MAKRSTTKKAATKSKKKTTTKRPSQKRDLVKKRGGAAFAKRKTDGTFKEMDDRGRSLSADSRKKAKKATKSGYGDSGDRKR